MKRIVTSVAALACIALSVVALGVSGTVAVGLIACLRQ